MLASAEFANRGAAATSAPVPVAHESTPVVSLAATAVAPAAAPAAAPDAVVPQIATNVTSATPFIAAVNSLADHHAQLAELHTAFLRQQFEVQSRFTNLRLAPLAQWATGQAGAEALRGSHEVVAIPIPPAAPVAPVVPVAHFAPDTQVAAPIAAPVSAPAIYPPIAAAPAPVAAALVAAPAAAPKAPLVRRVPPPRTPTGPSFERAALEIHADGEISTIFGPLFGQQDWHARQVRMPQPPLLLTDRVLGIEGVAGSMGIGTIWTETDVRDGAFSLHEGRMPAGVMVESGQADLMLISWLGADFRNKGERVYRLLGCELMSHGPLPTIGDTLHYETLVNGHAEQQGVRLFFFRYNCWVNGELRMSVRRGQAGFFTNEEPANSAGVLWSPEAATPRADARVDAPLTLTTRRAFSADHVTALIEGCLAECCGPGFESADAHTRTPTIAGGGMRLLDEVTHFDPTGGPWKRGYLRATLGLTPDRWFFDGHFKNDPCMPGTLMRKGGLQAMQIFMTGLGFTLDHDGSRVEPVPEQNYSLRCRGQATPASKEVVYEIFVEEIAGGDTPTLYADFLGSVDGRKAFHCKRMALRLRAGDRTVYTLKTVFGFFPGNTMKDQAGLPMTPLNRARLIDSSDVHVELGVSPAHYFNATPSLPTDRLVMIDRITGRWTEGELAGKARLGRLRAGKDVAARQWFFKAHFYQDPVQPGSLGIEALPQAVQALAIDLDLGAGLSALRFETQAVDVPMSWKYRGQVIPDNHVVVVDAEITEVRGCAGGGLGFALGRRQSDLQGDRTRRTDRLRRAGLTADAPGVR